MARGTGTYFTGTITGSNNVEDLYTEMETRIKAYQSNSTDAWAEYDVVTATAGSRDIVYQSKGDRTLTGGGDAHLHVRMKQNSSTAIYWRMYSDWSDDSSTGSYEAGTTGVTSGAWTGLSASTDMEFWGISNEFEFTIVLVQGGTYRWMSFGSQRRVHIPSKGSGATFCTNSETSGASVVIEVDRDITADITVGQQIWIYNRTPTATALRSATINLATVDAKAAGSITVDNLDNNIDAGAMIGLDPCPMYIGTGTTTMTIFYGVTFANATYTGAGSQTMNVEPLVELLTEGNIDPTGATGLYQGSECILDDANATKGGHRGSPEFVSFWSIGTQGDQDRMLPDYDTAQAHKVFISIKNGSFALAIGPGATA